jgi:hypothetical protein
MFYVSTKLFKKTTFYMVYVKITKFNTKISFFTTCPFIFSAQATKISFFFQETLCEHLECEDIHAYIFFLFFDILKFIFK